MATKTYPVLDKKTETHYIDPDRPACKLRKVSATEADEYPIAIEAIYGTGSKGWFVPVDAKPETPAK